MTPAGDTPCALHRDGPLARLDPTPARRRPAALLILLAALLAGICPAPSAVCAQEDGATEETLDDLPPLGASPALPAAADASEAHPTRTMLDTLKEGGLTGLLIGLLSVVAVGFMIEHGITIRRQTLMPDAVADELEGLLQAGQIDEAIEYCRDPQQESLLADVVLAGLQRYRSSEFGFAEYKAAVEEEGENQTGRLYRKTEVLGVIGAIAPMLGLYGTVLGMIEAFNQIASSGGAARPDELAGGISKALVTTLMGLFVAIPAMIAFSFFRNKIDSIVAETGKRVEQILMPLGRRRTS